MRILHTMLRVANLDRSIQFYTDVMGMRLLRKRDNEAYRYTLAFVGYQDEEKDAVLELTYNWDQDQYNLGDAYGHIAIEVESASDMCAQVSAQGGTVTRPAGPVKGGSTIIAFIQDPDGYKIELIERKHRPDFEL